MAITYAGVNLCIEDPGHEFQTWLDKTLSLEDLRLWGHHSISSHAGSYNCTTPWSHPVGLPQMNWPAPPRMKLNTLWWPTGATRWARGLFLVTKQQLATIWDACGGDVTWEEVEENGVTTQVGTITGGSPGRATLVLDDENGNAVSVSMYPLTPRPCTFNEGACESFLLPLVDERYLWQWIDAGDMSQVETWNDLFGALETALGCSIAWDIWPDDVSPDIEIARSYENAATLLDAAAYTIGARVVYPPDTQTVTLQYGNDAKAIVNAMSQGSTGSPVLAGGGLSIPANAVPKNVRVVFPCAWREEHKVEYGLYKFEKQTSAEDGAMDDDLRDAQGA